MSGGSQLAIRPGKGHSKKVVRCYRCRRSIFEINALRVERSRNWKCMSNDACERALMMIRQPAGACRQERKNDDY